MSTIVQFRIITRRGSNKRNTVIVANINLGFDAKLSKLEEQYLRKELEIAIRSALILQFGLKCARPLKPEEKEEVFTLPLFSGTTLPDPAE